MNVNKGTPIAEKSDFNIECSLRFAEYSSGHIFRFQGNALSINSVHWSLFSKADNSSKTNMG